MRLSRNRSLKTVRWTSGLLVAFLLAAGLATPGAAIAASPQPPNDYQLVWSDEFNRLDLGNRAGAWFPYWRSWNVRHLAGNNDQAAKYADDEMLEGGITAGAMLEREGRWGDGPFLHEVSAGTLKLRAYPLSSAGKAKTAGFPFIASMISGERQPTRNHGYWETRLRINRLGDGMHLAVWLLNDENEWPPEIDMLEVVGLHPAKFTANSHVKGGGAPDISSYAAPNGANGWHVLGFEWTEDRMRWTVNGQIVREHENLYGDDRLYFLVSWEVGGNWAGMPTGNTPWPGEAEIDYVRLYEEKPPVVTAAEKPAPETEAEPEQPGEPKPAPETAETRPPEPATEPPRTAEPAPEPAQKAEPEQGARPVTVTDAEQTTAPEPAPSPEPEPTDKPETSTAAPETPEPTNPPKQIATVEADAVVPEANIAPETTVEPAPRVLPQPSLAWRMARLRAFTFTAMPSQAPSPQPGPESSSGAAPASPPMPSVQPAPRSIATWRAMRDRARLFGLAE